MMTATESQVAATTVIRGPETATGLETGIEFGPGQTGE